MLYIEDQKLPGYSVAVLGNEDSDATDDILLTSKGSQQAGELSTNQLGPVSFKHGNNIVSYLEVQDTNRKWIVTMVIIPISGLYVPLKKKKR